MLSNLPVVLDHGRHKLVVELIARQSRQFFIGGGRSGHLTPFASAIGFKSLFAF